MRHVAGGGVCPQRTRQPSLVGAPGLAAVLLASLLLPAGAWGDDPTARAAYERAIPDDAVLLEQLGDAIELRRREDFDRMLDAREPGELIEHATLTYVSFDHRPVGIDTLFVVGDELFGYLFRPENGWGGGGPD